VDKLAGINEELLLLYLHLSSPSLHLSPSYRYLLSFFMKTENCVETPFEVSMESSGFLRLVKENLKWRKSSTEMIKFDHLNYPLNEGTLNLGSTVHLYTSDGTISNITASW
jgi:hypothetical protein